MNTILETASPTRSGEVEFVTFYVGDMLLGAEICHVEEINGQMDVTPVAHTPPCVRGVVNLRGEVATVLDLRQILGLGATTIGRGTRNVVVRACGERVGLLVDRIADVVRTKWSDMKPLPANMAGAHERLFQGVFDLDSQRLLVILSVVEVLATAFEPA